MKRTLTISILLLVLGGCATNAEMYLDFNYEGYKAKASTQASYEDSGWGFSVTSQEEANLLVVGSNPTGAPVL